MDVLQAINARRSIGRVTSEVPPKETIEQLLDAAVKAPNHHETQPWRFFVLSGLARQDFGSVLAEALRRRMSAEDETKVNALAAAEKDKPLRAPILIVVGVKHSDNTRIIPIEDLQACSAAIQNILLAAHSLGLATQWRTGEGAYDPLVKAYFGLDDKDEIAGFVYVGYPPDEIQIKPNSRSHHEVTEWRTAEIQVLLQ